MKAEYIDHMGSDLRIVDAARVSFDKTSEWEETEFQEGFQQFPSIEYSLKEGDQKLVGYLASHNHWTPFSHPMITLRETVPIFVARQRFKHKVGFTENEVSRRYVSDDPEFFTPTSWRGKPTQGAKQGSSDDLPEAKQRTYNICLRRHHEDCLDLYRSMMDDGIAPEQARMVLPQSMYTSYYVTGSLAAFANAYKLRADAHAQKEIQELAMQWAAIIEPLFPVGWSKLTSK